jgi:hypothetical protein
MSDPCLFAYNAQLIAVADDDEVLVYHAESEAPLWRERIEERVAYVALSAERVLALGARGTLRFFDHEARPQGLEHLDGEARGLSARAALTISTLYWLSPRGAVGERAVVEKASCLGAGAGGVAVGTEAGGLWIFEDDKPTPTRKVDCGGAIHAVARHPQRFWLVATGSKVLRVGDDGAVAPFTSTGDHRPRFLCCSDDGKYIGMALDDTIALAMAYPSKDTAGNATYMDRIVTGLGFGPAPWFGVGLDKGDGNKFNLKTGATHRTDTHPGREHNSWLLMSAFGEPEPPAAPAPPAPAPREPSSRGMTYVIAAVMILALLVLFLVQ